MLSNVEDELNAFRKHVITEARKSLTRNKKNASKTLYNDMNSFLKVSKNSFELGFEMPIYGQFQDQGVSGKKKKYNTPFSYKTKQPPSQVFEAWIKRKGIKGRDRGYTKKDGTKVKGTGRFITNKSLSYLIARSVFNNGIKPSLFFTRPFELAYKRLGDDIIEAFGLDIDEFLKYTLKKYD
jgi:hypothetical protein